MVCFPVELISSTGCQGQTDLREVLRVAEVQRDKLGFRNLIRDSHSSFGTLRPLVLALLRAGQGLVEHGRLLPLGQRERTSGIGRLQLGPRDLRVAEELQLRHRPLFPQDELDGPLHFLVDLQVNKQQYA